MTMLFTVGRFLIGPVGRYVLFAIVIFAAATWARQYYINVGYEAALKAVAAKNAEAAAVAEQVITDVDRCLDSGGIWSVITGECQ